MSIKSDVARPAFGSNAPFDRTPVGIAISIRAKRLDRPMPQLSISPTSIPPAPTQLPGSSTMSSIPAAGAVQNPLLAQPPPSAPPRSASVPDSDYSMQPLPPVSAPLQQLPNLPQMNMKEDIWLAPQMLGGGSRGDSPSAGDRLWGDTNLFGNGSFGTSIPVEVWCGPFGYCG